MKRNSLGWWLAASNVAIVLLVAAGISYFAIDMLRGLADSQQKIHVQLAGANAREEITRMAEDTLTYARVLAERPPLRPPARRARARRTGALPAPLLRDLGARRLRGVRRCAGGGLERRGAALAADLRRRQEQGERFMAVPAGTQFSVVGAVSKLPAQYSSFSVMVVHLLDDPLAATLLGAQRSAGAAHQLPRLQCHARQRIHLAALAGADRRPLRRAAHRQPGLVRLQLPGVLLERRGHRADRDPRLGHGDRSRGELPGVAPDHSRPSCSRCWRSSPACCWAGA